jgi:hypothetical protein
VGAKIQASNDAATWDTLSTVTASVHHNWNFWAPDTPLATQYRYVRLYSAPVTGTANCQWSEISVEGFRYYKTDIPNISTNLVCPVSLNVNGQTATLPQSVTYSSTATPTVTGITPAFGSQIATTPVTISGTFTGATSGNTVVTIDGIACTVTAATATQI